MRKLEKIREITVVGSGRMGHGIAQAFAQGGYPVTMYDVETSILERALSQIRSNLQTFAAVGLETDKTIDKILSNIRTSVDLPQAVQGAQFVIEAAPEDLAVKVDLFEKLDRYCPQETILASNTSTYLMSEMGEKARHKERLVIAHWFNPPHIMPTVEVVRGDRTSDEVFEASFQLLKKIGKRPVKVLKEVHGFLINRIQMAMIREIISLMEQGVAEPEDIDEGVRGSFGLRLAVIGPLRTMDMGGLDMFYGGMKNLYPLIERCTEAQKLLGEKVERGELGLKAGKGFFNYEGGKGLTGSNQSKDRDKKLLSLLKALGE